MSVSYFETDEARRRYEADVALLRERFKAGCVETYERWREIEKQDMAARALEYGPKTLSDVYVVHPGSEKA